MRDKVAAWVVGIGVVLGVISVAGLEGTASISGMIALFIFGLILQLTGVIIYETGERDEWK